MLICMTVRLQSGGVNPFDPFEVYYLVAFLCIMMFVPFNPFDFKPGEIVGHALEKAQAVAQNWLLPEPRVEAVRDHPKVVNRLRANLGKPPSWPLIAKIWAADAKLMEATL